jgi:hypothetical protein
MRERLKDKLIAETASLCHMDPVSANSHFFRLQSTAPSLIVRDFADAEL